MIRIPVIWPPSGLMGTMNRSTAFIELKNRYKVYELFLRTGFVKAKGRSDPQHSDWLAVKSGPLWIGIGGRITPEYALDHYMDRK